MTLAPLQVHASGNFINYFSFWVHLIKFISSSNFLKVSAFQINFGINSPVRKLNYSALHLLQLTEKTPSSVPATRSPRATGSELASLKTDHDTSVSKSKVSKCVSICRSESLLDFKVGGCPRETSPEGAHVHARGGETPVFITRADGQQSMTFSREAKADPSIALQVYFE